MKHAVFSVGFGQIFESMMNVHGLVSTSLRSNIKSSMPEWKYTSLEQR